MSDSKLSAEYIRSVFEHYCALMTSGDWQGLVAEAGVVDVVCKAVSSIRPLGYLAARHALRVVEELGKISPCGAVFTIAADMDDSCRDSKSQREAI